MIDEETIKEIHKMRQDGASVSSIARQLALSRPTVLKYLHNYSTPKANHLHTPPSGKKVILVQRPSQRVIDQRENVEIVQLEVERQKATKELEKVTGPKEHPALIEKKARVEVAELDIREYEARKKLQALREEELKRAQAEEQARIQKEMERQALQEERERKEKHENWIKGWQNWALDYGIPWGVSLPAEWKFKIKDTVGEVLRNRSQDEPKWDIEQLIKNTINVTIQPYLDELGSKKKVEETKRREGRKNQLISWMVFPEVDAYLRAQGLDLYIDEETKKKLKEYVRNHFMQTLTGNELIVSPNQVKEFLDKSLRSTKEKVKRMEEEACKEKAKRERQEKEKREAERRAFWEKVEEENEKRRIEELLQIGINRLNWYLLVNRKELGTIDAKEEERAKRHLERELKEEIEGNETDEEIEKIADEILDDFFFEE